MEFPEFVKDIGAVPQTVTISYEAYEKLLKLAFQNHKHAYIEDGSTEEEVKDEVVVEGEQEGGGANPTRLPIYKNRTQSRDRYSQSYIRSDFSKIMLSHNFVLNAIKKNPGITAKEIQSICFRQYGVKADSTQLTATLTLWRKEGKINTGKQTGYFKKYYPEDYQEEKKKVRPIAQAKVHKPKPSPWQIDITDNDRVQFAQEIGYKTLDEAVSVMGSWAFEAELKKWIKGELQKEEE